MFVILIFLFVLGLLVGSFLNVVIYRVDTGEGFLLSHSHCPHCNHRLAWYDLIPIVSFVFLRAKCRYCKGNISYQYPLVEAVTGILFVLSFLAVMNEFRLFSLNELEASLLPLFLTRLGFFLFLSSLLVIIAVYDSKQSLILDEFIIAGVLGTLLFYILILVMNGSWLFIERLDLYWGTLFPFRSIDLPQLLIGPLSTLLPVIAGIGAAGFFLFLVFLTAGRGMGGGDVKFAFLLGLILGWPEILLAVFLAFLTGAIVGVMLILRKKKNLKETIPFGPFLALGTLITLFWGRYIVLWYFTQGISL